MSKTSDKVYRHIEKKIAEGDWKPGDRITPEIELSKELKVSRVSTREAIQKLVTLKVLNKKVGVNGGTFVNEPSTEDYLENLLPLLILSEGDYSKIMIIRHQLEQLSVKEFIENHTLEDLKELEDTHDKMINSKDDLKKFLKYDILFHRLIARGSKNNILNKILEMLFNLNEHYAANIYETFSFEKNIYDHTNILEGIKMKEKNISCEWMKSHISRKIII